MPYVLGKQRDEDVVAAFRSYRDYLSENASHFPPSAYALATSEWYFNPHDHRCPHDAWLETATFTELSTGARSEIRSLTLTVRLLGAYHDGYIELVYPKVSAYDVAASQAGRGHRDWRYDEFRVAEGGRLIHEIEWAAVSKTGRWLIEASDVAFKWIPWSNSATL